jgi:hypothetical protein
MRALCGAIITAGALIGLGITALGIGTRYQYFSDRNSDGTLDFLKFKALDTPLLVILLFLIVASVIGLGLAFFGLALHHERRKHERMQLEEYPAASRSSLPSGSLAPGQRSPMP